MLSVITDTRVPVKLWVDGADETTLTQVRNVANLPFVFKHVALMPDAHGGYGVPIGCVFAADGIVVPNAVGVDIGCGMSAVRFNLRVDEFEKYRDDVLGIVQTEVPVGFAKHQTPRDSGLGDVVEYGTWFDAKVLSELQNELQLAELQIGTLGGGNHFIEFQRDEDDFVWLMIHSGSRHFGYWVAKYFNEKAKELNALWYSPVADDLAFLPVRHVVGKGYLVMEQAAREFAERNRAAMVDRVSSIVRRFYLDATILDWIDRPHNFVQFEHHFRKNVLVHRKGAISVPLNMFGIIPGSMGSNSYIVRGLGNDQSFHSASHGAGRAMGRNAARRELDLVVEQAKIAAVGSTFELDVAHLDEAPSAYKDIDQVMANQRDLVEVVHTLTPLGTIKG